MSPSAWFSRVTTVPYVEDTSFAHDRATWMASVRWPIAAQGRSVNPATSCYECSAMFFSRGRSATLIVIEARLVLTDVVFAIRPVTLTI